jgi:hypothetical protein
VCAALNQIVAPRGGSCWSGSDGVNVWVRLPPGVDSKHIQERSAAAGIRIADGEPFFIAPGQNHVVRLNAGSVEQKMLRRPARSWDKQFLIVVGRIPGRFTSSLGLHEDLQGVGTITTSEEPAPTHLLARQQRKARFR